MRDIYLSWMRIYRNECDLSTIKREENSSIFTYVTESISMELNRCWSIIFRSVNHLSLNSSTIEKVKA